MPSVKSALIAVFTASTLFASVIIDERFDPANPVLRLFKGRSGTVRTDQPGQATFDITNAGGSEAIWAFFTQPNRPLRLEAGDRIRVAITFSVSGFPANAQDIRFGIFDSQGTRNTTDLTGGMNQATFVGDPGYGLQYFASGSGSAFNIARRTNLGGANIFNSFADFLSLSPAPGSVNPGRINLAENTPYTLEWTVHRISSTESRISVSIAGLTFTATDSGSNLPDQFDYFGFRVIGPAFAQRIAFSRILVDYDPAPPVFTLQPQPTRLTVQSGSNITLTAAVARATTLRWNKDSQPLTTTTEPILTLANVRPADSGRYTLSASNAGGTVISDPVDLRVVNEAVPPAPVISVPPVPVTVSFDDPAVLSVVATGQNLAYQWWRGPNPIPGANASTLRLSRVTRDDDSLYSVLVTNPSGAVRSREVRLSVVSRLSVLGTTPTHRSTGTCLDTPLVLTFDGPVRRGSSGSVRLFRSDGALVSTFNVASPTITRVIGGTPYNSLPILTDGNIARLFFPLLRLQPGEDYSIEIEPGVLVDERGVPYRGQGAQGWSFRTRTELPTAGDTSLLVDAAGGGDFCTIQSAIDFVPANNTRRTVITVKPGEYVEQIYVPSNKPNLVVRGEDRNTLIRYPNNANLNSQQRQVFGVDAPDFTLEYLTIHNTTPKGGSQAEAFRGNNQRITLNYVNLMSFQDTLWLQGSAFVNSSYIEGDVDFVWGNGGVFVQDSELRMVSSGGYLTQIRNRENTLGNVFLDCRLTAEPGVSGGWLSRIDPGVFPFSQVYFIDTRMGPHIRAEGWLLNNATTAPRVQFGEFNSRNLDGSPLNVAGRAPFSRQLTAAEAERFRNPAIVLGWEPTTRLNAGIQLSSLERNFNGQPQAVVASTEPAGLPVRITYNGSSDPPTQVGTYTVSAVIHDDRYAGTATGQLVIRQTPVVITLRNLTQVADGSPKAVTATAFPLVPRLEISYNGSPTPPITPGRYTVVASVVDSSFRGRATATLNLIERPALRAFPGAEGEGAFATGGRGGEVYTVTNRNDAGPGSLRQGILSATGAPRTIVFAVAGNIELRSRLTINRDNLTIAGQTAPGGGITISGWPVVVSRARNIIIRHLRMRMGDANCPATQDDALWVDQSQNVIIDHVSASWSVDETLSVTDSTAVTVQWSFITESLRNSCHEKGAHGYGSLIRFGNGNVTYYGNLFAHHDSRNPRLGDNITLDFVNNVVYNWGSTAGYSGAADEGNTRLNLVGNAYIAGPASSSRNRAFLGGSANTAVYLENNTINGVNTEWQMISGTYSRREDSRHETVQIEAIATPEEAALAVLRSGGASKSRDSVDQRIVEQVQTRSGRIINSPREVGGLPTIVSATALPDSDSDGMPDEWERRNGLNPNDPSDGARASASGYTNLEVY
jgi:pectin methylesterase-like acyl-CoA thioesterase/pectate lyase